MSQFVSQSDLQVHLCSFKVKQSRECREEETKEWEGDWVRVRLLSAMMSAAAIAVVVVVFSSLLSSSPPFPSLLPSLFRTHFPNQLCSNCFLKTSPTERLVARTRDCSPPGRRHGRPVFPPDGWPVLSPVIILTRWMAGFFHRSYFSSRGWPVFSPVISLTSWVAGFATGDRR